MYAVNCSGKSFQLSLTVGGPPVAVPEDKVVHTYAAQIQNFSPDISFEGYTGPSSYLASITSAIRSHAASGDNVPNALSKSSANLAAGGVTFVTVPKNAVAPQYPE